MSSLVYQIDIKVKEVFQKSNVKFLKGSFDLTFNVSRTLLEINIDYLHPISGISSVNTKLSRTIKPGDISGNILTRNNVSLHIAHFLKYLY